MLVRTRARGAAARRRSRDEIAALRSRARPRQRAAAVGAADPGGLGRRPTTSPTSSATPRIVGVAAPHRVLAFGTWLEPDKAQAMEHAVDALARRRRRLLDDADDARRPRRSRPTAAPSAAAPCCGCATSAASSATWPSLTPRHEKLAERQSTSLRTLIDALPSPIWTRDVAGPLTFVNAAYARAVEAKDASRRRRRAASSCSTAPRATKQPRARSPATVLRGRGCRRSSPAPAAPSTCSTCRTATGSAGIGIDATEAETMRAELARMIDAHRRTLDQLADRRRHLRRRPAADLLQRRLSRAVGPRRRLPRPEPDRFRGARRSCAPRASCPRSRISAQWKAQLHEAYRAIEAKEHMWHLPDGRTLRVVTTPNPDGGVTYLFDDVTERLDLERRYDALIRVQGETLDNLAEARRGVRQRRPAAAAQSGLRRACGGSTPRGAGRAPAYRDRDRAGASRCTATTPLWQPLRAAVTAIDSREPVDGRLERRDGSVLDCATVPLPDGATLVDVPRRHRHGQRRARAARAQRGAGSRRRAQDRFRPPRLLRAALAAHQHHRLRRICSATRRPAR